MGFIKKAIIGFIGLLVIIIIACLSFFYIASWYNFEGMTLLGLGVWVSLVLIIGGIISEGGVEALLEEDWGSLTEIIGQSLLFWLMLAWFPILMTVIGFIFFG